jgi:hypothetical protein
MVKITMQRVLKLKLRIKGKVIPVTGCGDP